MLKYLVTLLLLFCSYGVAESNSNFEPEGCGCGCEEQCFCGCATGDPCTCGWQIEEQAWRHSNLHVGAKHAYECRERGVWLPEDPPLFRPFIADPRQLNYSVGWRFHDTVISKNVIPVSFWNSFVLYKLCDVGECHGQVEIGLDGGIWAVFAPLHEDTPLVNTDYYVGIPVSYAFGCWTFRVRGYHISSHLGDEFLLLRPDIDRKNPSAEYIDIFTSYQYTHDIRLYGGGGWLVAQDETFRCGSWFIEGGLEVRLHEFEIYSYPHMIYGVPFFAMHLREKPEYKRHVDMTYMIGYEFGKLCGLCRKTRFYLQYHDGYSVEGQFCKQPTNYFGLGMSYGY